MPSFQSQYVHTRVNDYTTAAHRSFIRLGIFLNLTNLFALMPVSLINIIKSVRAQATILVSYCERTF